MGEPDYAPRDAEQKSARYVVKWLERGAGRLRLPQRVRRARTMLTLCVRRSMAATVPSPTAQPMPLTHVLRPFDQYSRKAEIKNSRAAQAVPHMPIAASTRARR